MASRRANHVNTVLFDLDDTLLDSYHARIRALDKVLLPLSIPGLTATWFLQELKGGQLKDAFAALAATHNIRADLFTAYRRAYWLKKPDEIQLYPGVLNVLKKLKSAGLKLGIVTQKECIFEIDGQKVGAHFELLELGLSNIFSVAVGFADVTKYKPHPEGVLLALSKLGSNPDETLVVGDSPSDITAAHNAGCWSCYATWGLTNGGILMDNPRPNYTAKSPGALLKLDCLQEKLRGKEPQN